MCGFVGVIYERERTADAPTLERMAAVLKHRGPDDEGVYVDGPVGFAHKRLAIIDLVAGRQPMSTARCTIAYNGEIYNYLELRDELRARGRDFRTASDTEVILQAYEEWGPEAIERFDGMFAFVLHDRRDGTVLAARDHFGIKPLYVAALPDAMLFASEIKALLRHPGVTARVDSSALHEYLTFQHVLGEATLFAGIRRLLPGCYYVYDVNTRAERRVRYWTLDFAVDTLHTEEYFLERLRTLLERTVRMQMRSDVAVGAYLSGGFDSSVVTMLAARAAAAPLRTFTGAFDEGPEFDEREYARAVVAAAGALPCEILPTARELTETLPRLVWHMDEPAAGPGLFPQYVVAREASRQVRVVLGGQGGDEVFGGYARYVVAYLEQALKGAIFETTEEGEHIVSLRSILPNLPYLKRYVPMLTDFWRDGAFEEMDRRYFRLIDRSAGQLELWSDDLRAAYDREAVFARFQQIFNNPQTHSYYNKMTHFDMVASLPALLQVEDRVTMAHSLESRVPLLDRRIVDLVTPMPPAMKFKGAELKYIFKRAAGNLLPQRVRDRRDKMGFPVPLHLWITGPLRDYFHDLLLSRRTKERGLFDPAAVEALLASPRPFGRRLWGMANLELWHRIFIDGDGSAPEVRA